MKGASANLVILFSFMCRIQFSRVKGRVVVSVRVAIYRMIAGENRIPAGMVGFGFEHW